MNDFLTKISSLTASCFIVSLRRLRILLHRTLGRCLFLSESNIFENSPVNLFQSDLMSISRTEKSF